jgi:4'-phosphopantetheinyl transferase
VKDAKMSLASHLLKHFAITKLCNIPWSESTISRAANGKPCYIPKSPDGQPLAFNVSHQAGIVTLVASRGSNVKLGTDVVCVNERDDFARIERDGFFAWVDMHADVFAPEEIQALRMDTTQLDLPGCEDLTGYGRDAIARCQRASQRVVWKDSHGLEQSLDAKVVVGAKLRRFYALWCLREAYVKMTGEALLADWLRELEFRSFRTPDAAEGADTSELKRGEVVTEFEICFKRKKLQNVAMELTAVGRDYMVATAANLTDGDLSVVSFKPFEELDLEAIYATAQGIGKTP